MRRENTKKAQLSPYEGWDHSFGRKSPSRIKTTDPESLKAIGRVVLEV